MATIFKGKLKFCDKKHDQIAYSGDPAEEDDCPVCPKIYDLIQQVDDLQSEIDAFDECGTSD